MQELQSLLGESGVEEEIGGKGRVKGHHREETKGQYTNTKPQDINQKRSVLK